MYETGNSDLPVSYITMGSLLESIFGVLDAVVTPQGT
jgi:hypothetical protein